MVEMRKKAMTINDTYTFLFESCDTAHTSAAQQLAN